MGLLIWRLPWTFSTRMHHVHQALYLTHLRVRLRDLFSATAIDLESETRPQRFAAWGFFMGNCQSVNIEWEIAPSLYWDTPLHHTARPASTVELKYGDTYGK